MQPMRYHFRLPLIVLLVPLTQASGGDSLSFKPAPIILTVATAGENFDVGSVTDVEAADFDRDGLTDLAVAWYLTDFDSTGANIRALSIYYGTGSAAYLRAPDISLSIAHPIPVLSVFRIGTGELAIGDFDGDGDADIAALPFFSDEMWFIENVAPRQFVPRVRYIFGLNTSGNSVTPSEAAAADFDGDGRDELVYIVDPIQRLDGVAIHFWRTSSTISAMNRVSWEGISDDYTLYTRGLAIADFDGDQKRDLAFTATTDSTEEVGPIAVVWSDLDSVTRRFAVSTFPLGLISADVAELSAPGFCAPGLLVGDKDGAAMELWRPGECNGVLGFEPISTITGFGSCSFDRGMAVAVADLNADGNPDIVARQKVGDESCRHIDVVMGMPGEQWSLLEPAPIDSTGFSDPSGNEILRPRNLAVADLFGSRLPEIVAGFGPTRRGAAPPPGLGVLEIAIWANGCVGDMTIDGVTDLSDLTLLLSSFGCAGVDPTFREEADLDRDGCVGLGDLALLLSDFGCECCGG